MKQLILSLLMSVPLIVIAQQDSFAIRGKVGNLNAPARVYLIHEDAANVYIDSANLKNGRFQFKGVVPGITNATMILDHKGEKWNNLFLRNIPQLCIRADVLNIYLEKGALELDSEDSLAKAMITGSPINEEYARYKAFLAGPGSDKKELQKKFIAQNPSSFFSLQALKESVGYYMNVPEIEPVFRGFSESLRFSQEGKAFAQSIESARSTSVGAMAPMFTMPDVNGKAVSLADFRGRYILIDFWATWCHPCMIENFHIAKLFNQFKDKNFIVIGISLDIDRKSWLAGIKKCGLGTTVQLCSLQPDPEVAKLYRLGSVGHNMLIGPDGKIIATEIRGDDLEKELTELLK